MSQLEEQFDLAPQIDEPMNSFKVVHLHNKSETYHLTRQVLLDSVLTQYTYCFFYHILAKDPEEFNDIYGSFACLIPQNIIEANLYLNVDSMALEHIIKYIQTSKLNQEFIYATDCHNINEIIDLATMFGMPNLVTMLRNLQPSHIHVNKSLTDIKKISCLFVEKITHQMNLPNINQYTNAFENFFDNHSDNIINKYFDGSVSNIFLNGKWLEYFTMIVSFVLRETSQHEISVTESEIISTEYLQNLNLFNLNYLDQLNEDLLANATNHNVNTLELSESD